MSRPLLRQHMADVEIKSSIDEIDELTQPVRSTAETLRARAKALAKKRAKDQEEESFEIVEFLLDNESYGFQPQKLREICLLSYVTTIPCTPSFIVGVINLRGQIITIVNIKILLGFQQQMVAVHNKAIIIESGKLCIGFLADEVVGVRKVAVSSMQHTLSTLSGLSATYLKGITTDRMIILDVEKILNDSRFSQTKK